MNAYFAEFEEQIKNQISTAKNCVSYWSHQRLLYNTGGLDGEQLTIREINEAIDDSLVELRRWQALELCWYALIGDGCFDQDPLTRAIEYLKGTENAQQYFARKY